MSKYHFPVIPKPVEVIFAWTKAISHQNSQNSRFPKFLRGSKGIRMSKNHFPIIPKPVEVILPYIKDVSHDNSQNNSRIPGIAGRVRVSRTETTPYSDI